MHEKNYGRQPPGPWYKNGPPIRDAYHSLTSYAIPEVSMVSAAKLKKMILAEIAVQPMSLKEIAEKMELKEKRTYRLLKGLFEKDQIESNRGEDGIRRYSPSEEA